MHEDHLNNNIKGIRMLYVNWSVWACIEKVEKTVEEFLSFQTEYHANENTDVNNDVMVCMKMHYTHSLVN